MDLSATDQYDSLIQMIYEGPLEHTPWSSLLPELRRLFDAKTASLILRPPAEGDTGVILNSLRPEANRVDVDAAIANPSDWQATNYREQFFSLDPFVNLPPGEVITLDELMSHECLLESPYYRQYLQPIGVLHIMGADALEPGGLIARIRFARGQHEPAFNRNEKKTLSRLLPHIERAARVHTIINRTASERDLYANTVDQLSLGTIILGDNGLLLSSNQLAKELLKTGDGVYLHAGQLRLSDAEVNRELQSILTTAAAAGASGTTSMASALRVPRRRGINDLGLVVRPIATGEWAGSQSEPRIAVFLSDPQRQADTSHHILAELFGLTPAEARLSILLARGISLANASEQLNVTQHTVRAQLKSIFTKTGATRQAELVGLILKSVATLG